MHEFYGSVSVSQRHYDVQYVINTQSYSLPKNGFFEESLERIVSFISNKIKYK